MKLEIGMYVRDNRDGEITKITEFDLRFRINKNTYEFEKASFNIIDLIEAGDYVNGVEVIDKRIDNLGEEYLECGVGDYIVCTYYTNEIENIITKEQFENMEYIVGDNNG